MLIIVEGPDGAGKSTLVDALRERLLRSGSNQVDVLHAGPPKAHPLDEYLRPLSNYRPADADRHIIIDRWYWGELVYPTVRGRQTDLTPEVRWSIEAYLQRLGAVVVLQCQGRVDYARVFEQPDRIGDRWQLDELDVVEKLFDDAYSTTPLKCVTNWNDPNATASDAVIRNILYTAALEQSKVTHLNQFVTYLGPPTPTFLLVGDVRHNFKPNTPYPNPRDPAFLPFRATSGAYLLDALLRTPFDPHTFGVINGCDVDHVEDAWAELDKPRLVALGRNAEARLGQLGLPHGAVPHPQFIRRFHHRDIEAYARALVRALVDQERITWPTSFEVRPDENSIPTSSTT
jgi:thymidylate kinase